MQSTAHAQQVIRADDFFDLEYARGLWLSGMDLKALASYDAEKCPVDGAYEKWKAEGKDLVALDNHPHAEQIRRCNDLWLVSMLWGEMYVQWRHGIGLGGSDGWNDCGSGLRSMRVDPAVLKDMNVFTGRCDDMPDWRTPKNRGEDEANIEKGNMRLDATRALRGK